MRLYFLLAMIPCKFWERRVIDQVITSFGISPYICCPFPPFYLAMNTDRTQPDGEICLDGPAQNLTPSPPGHAEGYVKILRGWYTRPSSPPHRVIYIHECEYIVYRYDCPPKIQKLLSRLQISRVCSRRCPWIYEQKVTILRCSPMIILALYVASSILVLNHTSSWLIFFSLLSMIIDRYLLFTAIIRKQVCLGD